MKLDTWVTQWETTYDACVIHGLPDVQGERPIYDFLTAVANYAPYFTAHYRVRMSDPDEDVRFDFLKVVKHFKNYRGYIVSGQKARRLRRE